MTLWYKIYDLTLQYGVLEVQYDETLQYGVLESDSIYTKYTLYIYTIYHMMECENTVCRQNDMMEHYSILYVHTVYRQYTVPVN